MVIGADGALGAALVRALIARGSAKVYAAKADGSRCKRQPGAVHVRLDTVNPALADMVSSTWADVTLLFNCLEAVQHGSSALAGTDIQPDDSQTPPARRTLKLIEAFAPVLAARGGGAVVNVLSVVAADAALGNATPAVDARTVDWVLANGLRGQLVAQGTALLYFRVQNAVAMADPGRDDGFGGHGGLAEHFAMRVLNEVEAVGQLEGHAVLRPMGDRMPASMGAMKGTLGEPKH